MFKYVGIIKKLYFYYHRSTAKVTDTGAIVAFNLKTII